jgi:O-antigen biosynthesis protein
MPAAPRVSLILLACDKARFTRACLDALGATDYPRLEIFLIDNGSGDEIPEVFDAFAGSVAGRDGWTVERIRFEENIGAIAGRNAALERFAGEHVVFMDNDIVVDRPDWLGALVERLEREPDLGAVGPKLVFPRPRGMIQCAGCAVTPGGRVTFLGRGEPADEPAYNVERECQCLISALWLLRGEAVRQTGLLDRAYDPVQFEDIDYCYRLRENGWRVLYFPLVSAYHYENVTTDGTSGINYRYVTVRNGLTFKRRWRHCFANENGPAESEVEWRELPRVSWEELEDEHA